MPGAQSTSTEFLFGDNFSDEVKSIGEWIKLTRTVERQRAPRPQNFSKNGQSRTNPPPPPPPPTFRTANQRGGEAVAIKGSAGIQAPEPHIPASQQASSSGQSTPLIIVSSKPDLVINNTPNNFIGGKAGFHLSTWKSITSDSWILSQIEGVFPEFDSPPHQEKPPQPITWSDTEKLALALEIESLKNQ